MGCLTFTTTMQYTHWWPLSCHGTCIFVSSEQQVGFKERRWAIINANSWCSSGDIHPSLQCLCLWGDGGNSVHWLNLIQEERQPWVWESRQTCFAARHHVIWLPKSPRRDHPWRPLTFKPGTTQVWGGAGVSVGSRANLPRAVGTHVFLAATLGMNIANELGCFVIRS